MAWSRHMDKRMRKAHAALVTLALGWGAATPARAEGLSEIYALAQRQDAIYTSARYQLEAVQTLNQQARGVLFPSIDLNGGATRSWLEVDSQPVALPGPPGTPPTLIDQSGETSNAEGGTMVSPCASRFSWRRPSSATVRPSGRLPWPKCSLRWRGRISCCAPQRAISTCCVRVRRWLRATPNCAPWNRNSPGRAVPSRSAQRPSPI